MSNYVSQRSIMLLPIMWEQTIYSTHSHTKNKNIRFVARVTYPEDLLLSNGLLLAKLRVVMSVTKMPVLDLDGEAIDLSKKCGSLDFLDGYNDSEAGAYHEPSLSGWFCLEPPEFDDIWERVKRGYCGKTVVSLAVTGIKSSPAPDPDFDEWKVEATPSLTILNAEVRFTYDVSISTEKP